MRLRIINSSLFVLLLFVNTLYAFATESDEKQKNRPIRAESEEQIIEYLISAIKADDVHWIEQIVKTNSDAILQNELLTVQIGNTLFQSAIQKALEGDNDAGKQFLNIVAFLGETYQKSVGSDYLTNKVKLYDKWSGQEKKLFIEAEELYGKGDKLVRKYKYDQAIKHLENAFELYRQIKYKEGEANSLKSLGDVYRMLSEYENARQIYEQGLVIYREIKDRLGEANSLQSLGEIYRMVSDNKKARQCYEQGLVIFRKIKNRLGEAGCLEMLGNVYISLSEYQKGRQLLEKGLVINRKIKDRLGEANCLQSLGDVYIRLDENEKAGQLLEKGLVLYREIEERLGEANCLQSLGDVHINLSEIEKARQRYEQGLEIFKEIKERIGEANCLQSLGDVHLSLSEYEKAHQLYEQGLVIFRENKDRVGEGNCLKSVGDVYMMLNEYEKARQNYENGLVVFREIKDRLGQANCLRSLGDVQLSLTEYKKAQQCYEQGLEIFQEIKDRLGEANCLKSIGVVYRILSDNKKAQQYFEQGLLIFREIKDHLGEANSLGNLGDVYRVLSNYEEARQLYEQGFALQQKIGDRYGGAWTLYKMGKLSEAENNFPQAKMHYSRSIEMIEDVWEEMKLEEHKTSFLATSIAPYESMIALLFRNHEKAEAYEYAQRSKARSFLYLMGNDRIDPKKGVPLKLARQEKELKRKIILQTQKIIENEKKASNQKKPAAELNKELSLLKEKHSEVLFKIKLNSPEYASLISINPLSLENIQALLKQEKETLFIEYYTTDEATFLWAIDENDIKGYEIPVKRSDLYTKVEKLRTMLAHPTFGVDSLSSLSETLYDFLLQPVEKHIQGKQVICIIPHGTLHYLPFDVLMKNGKFLMERGVKLFYLPNASSYKYSREKNPLKKEQLVAFGDPDKSLPFSKKEVEGLKKLYPLNPKILKRAQATETNAKYYAKDADILHFACHGKFNSDKPLYSSLSLQIDDNNDGNLEVSEIFQLELKPAYLVTLSACETYLGGIRQGDEIVGMARAFMYAGTPSILASLWKVDDYYTQKLMVAFYRALKHSDKIEALYKARQVMIETYGKRHPFYWAGFVLMGDYR